MMFAVLRLACVLAAGFSITVCEPALEAIQRSSPTGLKIQSFFVYGRDGCYELLAV
jgi:hypothetical protein